MEIYNHPEILVIILALGLPIIAVILYFVSVILKRKQRNEIQRLIIEKNIDPDTAKILIGDPKRRMSENGLYDFDTLRKACILIGVGLGALICKLAAIEGKSIYFWLVIASCVGFGLLCAFIIEMQLNKKSKLPNL